MIDAEHKWTTSFKPLILGFILSLFLLFAAYELTTHHILSGLPLLLTILGLATLQVLFQCFLFLNISGESTPRWSLITFLFTVIVLIIIVGGSLWIMYDLDYQMMPHT